MTPLEDLERLRAEFPPWGMVSHELRTPLSTIRGSADTLLEAASELDPAEMAQFHRIIRDQTDNMRYLIGDLLDVARIETGELPVNPEPSNFMVLVDEARSRFQAADGTNDLLMEIPDDLPQILVDRRRISQVLDNLLANASAHSQHSSAIRVAAMSEGVYVVVSITDEGRGIPAERLPHLFRKYSSLERKERSREPGGSGLGLIICKGIVEAHGGRIWAESDGPDLGSRFTFTIPVVEGSADLAIQLSGRAERRRQRILCVDDDPQMLRYLRNMLTRAGFTPVVTADPTEALQLVEEKDPHLVLLDLVMPGTDGIDLMKDIFDIVDIPAIFISAYGQEENVVRAFDNGAADYILKPFSSNELTARIRSALRRREPAVWAAPTEPYRFGELVIDYAERQVVLAGNPMRLTAIEYDLLAELATNAGQVITNFQLLRRVWGPEKSSDSGPVRNIIKRLRRKLGDGAANPTYIFNEPRVGYHMPKGKVSEQQES